MALSIVERYRQKCGNENPLYGRLAAAVNPLRIRDFLGRFAYEPDGSIRNRFAMNVPGIRKTVGIIKEGFESAAPNAELSVEEWDIADDHRRIPFQNISLLFKPEDSGAQRGRMAFFAHYDALGDQEEALRSLMTKGMFPNIVNTNPGIYDNGTGVAVLMEMARVLGEMKDYPLPFEIELCALGAEELRYLDLALVGRDDPTVTIKGSRIYAQDIPENIDTAVILDTIGRRRFSNRLYFMSYWEPEGAVEKLKSYAREAGFLPKHLMSANYFPGTMSSFVNIHEKAVLISDQPSGPFKGWSQSDWFSRTFHRGDYYTIEPEQFDYSKLARITVAMLKTALAPSE